MKKTFTELEFFKGDIKNLENHLIQLEKYYILSNKEIINAKSFLKQLYSQPLQEYRKIQIKNLIHYINQIEKNHHKNYKIISKSQQKINKLENTSLLEAFSHSVETHLIKKIKKDYDLKPKIIKEKPLFIIFNSKKYSLLYSWKNQKNLCLLFYSYFRTISNERKNE
ncbi:MAG: hypothetical protein KatS3mg129_1986 [Leptospiraceae bacterium]|nr:MAG: hypothetical protein KatS3mg129_1986 [Leptospiraceae bacterium]